ncbi:histidine kinase [Neolewinella agarilytica]|uniref:sensor histidine kinase n=1 Tax=Neolewinella agarilytica TaxID=478744 RepID=UPI00235472F2|nr:histidine kinase [Neolewinella agarilytica]
MRFLCQLAVFFLGQLLLCSGLVAQDVQLDFRHFTTDDGLPSSEVYTVLEDQEGYIWVGTDNGVARFDGYEFEVFDSDDGLEDVVVFYLHLDTIGTVWAGTYSGRVYYFERGRFVEFAHNDKIASTREFGEFVNFIDISQEGEIIIRLQKTGIFGFSQNGGVRKISGEDSTHFYIYSDGINPDRSADIFPVKRGYLNNVNRKSNDSMEMKYMVGSGEYWQMAGMQNVLPSKLGNTRTHYWIDLLPGGYLAAANGQSPVIFHKGRKVGAWPVLDLFINQMISLSDSNALVLADVTKGMYQFRFKEDYAIVEIDTIFENVSFSYGLFDEKGGLWVSSLEEGLFYCPFFDQRKYVFDAGLKILSVKAINRDDFFEGTSTGGVVLNQFRSSFLRKVVERRIDIGAPINFIYYDQEEMTVYSNQFEGKIFAWLGDEDVVPYSESDDERYFFLRLVKEINKSRYVGVDSLLVSNRESIGFLDRKTGEVEIINKKNSSSVHRIESFYIDKNRRYLLGTVTGLKQFIPDENGGTFVNTDLGIEELNERVVKILELQDGSLLFGTRGNGIVHLGEDTLILRQSDGLASNMVRHLHQSDDGAIWVSTLSGLSKVELGNGKFKIRTFRTENGLIDNEVHMVDTYGDAVYLATSSGVQRFVEPPLDTVSKPPAIRLLTVDGHIFPIQGDINLSSGYHSVNIHYGTINHRLGSNINYRYRLDDEDDWTYTQQRTVSFPRLGAGSFNFSVQSQNEDGFWSEDTQLIIDIPKRWYNTVYALVGLLFLVGSVIAAIFYIREQRSRKEQSFISQISKLEHEALHARMNPHFVFNCLNSIQNFVLENDTRSAATYLSRFSSLIRQILRSSVDGKHTLREEVQMLEKYLELEKLRFKTAFTYTITVDASLDEDGISLAPLLIQPFVENAILHGMKGRKAGGKISVDFAGNAQLLQVTVTDNGVGINRKLPQKKDSMGMDITLQRLEAMKHAGEQRSGMEITSLYHADGTPAGTKVELAVVPESSRPVIS